MFVCVDVMYLYVSDLCVSVCLNCMYVYVHVFQISNFMLYSFSMALYISLTLDADQTLCFTYFYDVSVIVYERAQYVFANLYACVCIVNAGF